MCIRDSVTTYTRYDEDGEPYEYTVCTVTLENFDLSHPVSYTHLCVDVNCLVCFFLILKLA